jgi:WD40 repeat protein
MLLVKLMILAAGYALAGVEFPPGLQPDEADFCAACAREVKLESSPFALALDNEERIERFYLWPDRPVLVALTESKILIWEIDGQKARRVASIDKPFEIRICALVPESHTIVLSALFANTLAAIDYSKTPAQPQIYSEQGQDRKYLIAPSPDGRFIFTAAGEDSLLEVWKQSAGSLTKIKENQETDHIESIAFSADGKRFAIGLNHGDIEVYYRDDQKVPAVKSYRTSCLRFDQVIIPDDGLLHVFEFAFKEKVGRQYTRLVTNTVCNLVDGGTRERLVSENLMPAAGWCSVENQRRILLAQKDGLIIKWDIASGKPLGRYRLDRSIASVRSGNNGKLIVIVLDNESILAMNADLFLDK